MGNVFIDNSQYSASTMIDERRRAMKRGDCCDCCDCGTGCC
jgi:hypothetical protein